MITLRCNGVAQIPRLEEGPLWPAWRTATVLQPYDDREVSLVGPSKSYQHNSGRTPADAVKKNRDLQNVQTSVV